MSGAASLRQDFEAALLAEIERVGIDALDRGAVVRRFASPEASQRTLYRWCADLVDSGRAGQHLAAVLTAAAAARAARSAAPAADAAREAVAAMPTIATPATIVGTSPVGLVENLGEAIRCVNQVMTHARDAEGKVRNAKLLLTASGTLSRCLDTAIRLYAAMHQHSALEAFHASVLAEVAAESPATAERIVARLKRLGEQRRAA